MATQPNQQSPQPQHTGPVWEHPGFFLMVLGIFAATVYALNQHLHRLTVKHAGIVGWAETTGLKVLIIAAVLVLLTMAAMIVIRLTMRSKRAGRMKFCEIVLGPDDESTPFEVMSALDSIHGTLLARYARTMAGQNYFTFEVMRSGDGRVRFVLGATSDWLHTVEDILRSKYTNIRFEECQIPGRYHWTFAQHITLGKHWRHSTKTVKDYQNSIMETIVQSLDRSKGEAILQCLFLPLTAKYHDQLQGHIRAHEYATKAQQVVDPANPGTGYMDSQIIKDSLQNVGKGAYSVEIRMVAETWETCQRVFGALSEANGENRFRAATVIVFKNLWMKWFNLRQPSMAIWKRNIMFSFPLATIIHLPTSRLRVTSLNRKLVRRGNAFKEILRDPSMAILVDEEGPVGIWEEDRKYNVLMLGGQGGGKSTDILNIFKNDANYRDKFGRRKTIVLIDIGKDTAKRALGILPPDREVLYFDPSDPNCPWTMNPLIIQAERGLLVDNLLEAMTQVFGEEAIRANSRMFLANSILAVMEVEGPNADMTKVYDMLISEEYRNDVASRVTDSHQKKFWNATFQQMSENPRFLEEIMAPSRNKIDEILRHPLVRAMFGKSGGRKLLDMNDIIYGRKTLVCNIDKTKLGEGAARLTGIFLITALWHAALKQAEIPEDERVPISLIMDEFQNFASKATANILAEGRAFGFQTTIALRFLDEVEDPLVQKSLEALASNLIIHQFELVKEADEKMKKMMRKYANMVQVNAESQDAISFGADDFLRLPKFHAICRFKAHGDVRPAFVAQTIRWEKWYHKEWADYHQQNPLGNPAKPFTEEKVEEEPDGLNVEWDFVDAEAWIVTGVDEDGVMDMGPASCQMGLPAGEGWEPVQEEKPEKPPDEQGKENVPKPDRDLGVQLRKVANKYSVSWIKLWEIVLEQEAPRERVLKMADWALQKDIKSAKTFYDSWRAAFKTAAKRAAEKEEKAKRGA